MALRSRLLGGASRETAGPVSPPLRMLAREVRRRPPLILASAPWHLKQVVSRIGRTCNSKNCSSCSVGGASAFAVSARVLSVIKRLIQNNLRRANAIHTSTEPVKKQKLLRHYICVGRAGAA